MHCAKNDLPLQWFGRIHWQSQQRWTAKLRELHGDPKLSRLLQSLGSRLKARVARDSGDSQPPNRPKNTWPCHFGFRMCKVRLKALSKATLLSIGVSLAFHCSSSGCDSGDPGQTTLNRMLKRHSNFPGPSLAVGPATNMISY